MSLQACATDCVTLCFIVTALTSFIVVVMFGVFVLDRTWMSRPRFNFLSWGFVFMVISAIFALLAGLCLLKAGYDTYCVLLRKEKDRVSEALELSRLLPLSSECVHDGVSLNKPAVVAPEGSTIDHCWPLHPAKYSSLAPHRLSVQKPADVEMERTMSTMKSNECEGNEKAKLAVVDLRDCDGQKYVAKASFYRTIPSSTHCSEETDQADELYFTIGSVDPSSQNSATFGKSYSRYYSNSSSSYVDPEIFIPKIERQY